MLNEHPEAAILEIHTPLSTSSSILAAINSDADTYWKMDYRYFDQYTLEELPVDHMWGRFHEASGADKLMRLNYDIHTGAVFGLAGKILAFLASLLCASLPVTGFVIWWGRKKKGSKPVPKASPAREKEPELQTVNAVRLGIPRTKVRG